mmetsp:Transcript_72578/g.208352  ORF Transcript_72578/g.208352 Transcript_72578/m.208352 type:complete len:335 (-) Transcript_72578:1415-2419(-)
MPEIDTMAFWRLGKVGIASRMTLPSVGSKMSMKCRPAFEHSFVRIKVQDRSAPRRKIATTAALPEELSRTKCAISWSRNSSTTCSSHTSRSGNRPPRVQSTKASAATDSGSFDSATQVVPLRFLCMFCNESWSSARCTSAFPATIGLCAWTASTMRPRPSTIRACNSTEICAPSRRAHDTARPYRSRSSARPLMTGSFADNMRETRFAVLAGLFKSGSVRALCSSIDDPAPGVQAATATAVAWLESLLRVGKRSGCRVFFLLSCMACSCAQRWPRSASCRSCSSQDLRCLAELASKSSASLSMSIFKTSSVRVCTEGCQCCVALLYNSLMMTGS